MIYRSDFYPTHHSPHGMSQIYFIEDVFREYFSRAIIPDRIIELGTASGEFSQMIYKLRAEASSAPFDFYTFDVKQQFQTIAPELNFYEVDIFKVIEYIGGLIKDNTLILCDNGDKVRELHCLSPFLRKNCVIMAHDYFASEDVFYRENSWPACEITDADIQDLALEPYLPEIMTRGIWLSLIKK